MLGFIIKNTFMSSENHIDRLDCSELIIWIESEIIIEY